MRNRPRVRGPGARRRPRSRCRPPARSRASVPCSLEHRPSRSCPCPRSAARGSHGQPRSAIRPTLRQAPWVTTMPVSPGRERRQAARSAPATHPLAHLLRSPPRPRHHGRVVAGQPGGVLLGERRRELREGQALPRRRRRTPAAAGRARRPGRSRRRRTPRSRRARARSLDHSAAGPQRGQVRRRRGGLGAADVVERDVGVTLRPPLGVPRGPAVPEQHEPLRASPLVGDDVGRQRDRRAVAPEPLEGVELPLLLVLDVHDDLAVVDEHPAPVALALAADRLGADLAELVLDLVDDRLDLAVVGGRGEQEGVGDGELLADVEGDDLLAELVGGRAGGGVRRARRRGRWRSCVVQSSSRRVEVVLGDVLDDAVGHEVPDRLAPALARRGSRSTRSPARGSRPSSPGRPGSPSSVAASIV